MGCMAGGSAPAEQWWMNTGRTVFAQLIAHISHIEFQKCVAKLRPLKQGEAEIDGGRIERIKGVVEMVEIHADEILDMKRSGEADQIGRKIGEDYSGS